MPVWAEIVWCGLFLLLSRPPKWLGIRGASIVALILGVGPRVWYVAYTAGSLWLLNWVLWIVAVTFYVMTALWVVFLMLLYRRRPVRKLAAIMARLAAIESAGVLNSFAGVVMTLVMGDVPRTFAGPLIAAVYSVAQIVFFFRFAKGAL